MGDELKTDLFGNQVYTPGGDLVRTGPVQGDTKTDGWSQQVPVDD